MNVVLNRRGEWPALTGAGLAKRRHTQTALAVRREEPQARNGSIQNSDAKRVIRGRHDPPAPRTARCRAESNCVCARAMIIVLQRSRTSLLQLQMTLTLPPSTNSAQRSKPSALLVGLVET